MSLASLYSETKLSLEAAELALKTAEESLQKAQLARNSAEEAYDLLQQMSGTSSSRNHEKRCCFNCKSNPCISGMILEETIKNSEGMRVKATIGCTSNQQGKMATIVQILSKKKVQVKWDFNKKLSKCKLYTASKKPRFLIECNQNRKNDFIDEDDHPCASVRNSKENGVYGSSMSPILAEAEEEFPVSYEDSDGIEEDFLLLASPRDPIVDLEEADDELEDQVTLCSNCQHHPCLDGQPLTPDIKNQEGMKVKTAEGVECSVLKTTKSSKKKIPKVAVIFHCNLRKGRTQYENRQKQAMYSIDCSSHLSDDVKDFISRKIKFEKKFGHFLYNSGNDKIPTDREEIEFGVCGNCNNNPCLNGKSVTDDNLVLDWSLLSFMIHDNLQINSLTRVKEKETRKGRFGTILPYENNQVVKILWDHLDCRQYDILHVKKKLPNFEFACDTPCPDLIQPAVKTFFRVTAQWQKSGELFKVLSSDNSEEEEEC